MKIKLIEELHRRATLAFHDNKEDYVSVKRNGYPIYEMKVNEDGLSLKHYGTEILKIYNYNEFHINCTSVSDRNAINTVLLIEDLDVSVRWGPNLGTVISIEENGSIYSEYQ